MILYLECNFGLSNKPKSINLKINKKQQKKSFFAAQIEALEIRWLQRIKI